MSTKSNPDSLPIIAASELPAFKDKSEGIDRRLLIVEDGLPSALAASMNAEPGNPVALQYIKTATD